MKSKKGFATMENKEIFENRAHLQNGSESSQDCTEFECCGEELVFAMQDTKHKFSLGLSTVLECLMIAEKEGYVPPLAAEWWYQIRQH